MYVQSDHVGTFSMAVCLRIVLSLVSKSPKPVKFCYFMYFALNMVIAIVISINLFQG